MMRVTANSEELVARYNARSDLFWVALPLPVLLIGAALSDVRPTAMQWLVISALALGLLVIIATKIEWITFSLERRTQRGQLHRQKLIGALKHEFLFSEIIRARPEAYPHETGSLSHRLIIEIKSAEQDGEITELPIGGVAKDWDALAVSNEINDWLARNRDLPPVELSHVEK